MNEIIEKLETIASDIRYDISADWNDSKYLDTVQLMKIENAIGLLKSVGENRNM